MQKRKLFISRSLDADSPFRELEGTFEIHDLSLLEFQMIKMDSLPESDWLFFYSQQGVKHFFMQQNLSADHRYRIAAFAPKTAQLLHEHVDGVHFVGNGRSESTAQALQVVGMGESIAFIQARTSIQSVQKNMSLTVEQEDIVVYDNRGKKEFTLPFCDFLVFTSPMNAKTYLSKYKIESGQSIFAIGSSTSKTIVNLTGAQVLYPETPGERQLRDLVKEHM